jgi:hypothetical protein
MLKGDNMENKSVDEIKRLLDEYLAMRIKIVNKKDTAEKIEYELARTALTKAKEQYGKDCVLAREILGKAEKRMELATMALGKVYDPDIDTAGKLKESFVEELEKYIGESLYKYEE